MCSNIPAIPTLKINHWIVIFFPNQNKNHYSIILKYGIILNEEI